MFAKKLILALSYPIIASLRLGTAHILTQFFLVLVGAVGFYASQQLLSNIIDPLSRWSMMNILASALAAFLIFSILFPSTMLPYRREPSTSEVSVETLSISLVQFFPTALLTTFGILVSTIMFIIAAAGAEMLSQQIAENNAFNGSRFYFGLTATMVGTFCTTIILPKVILTPFVGIIKDCQARAAYMTASAILERRLLLPFLPAAIVVTVALALSITSPWAVVFTIWYAAVCTIRMVQFELENLRVKHLALLRTSSQQIPDTFTYVGGKAHLTGTRGRSTVKLGTIERDTVAGGMQ